MVIMTFDTDVVAGPIFIYIYESYLFGINIAGRQWLDVIETSFSYKKNEISIHFFNTLVLLIQTEKFESVGEGGRGGGVIGAQFHILFVMSCYNRE